MDYQNTQAVPFAVAVAATDSVLLGPNPDRYAITFSPPPANRYTISFDNLAVLDVGITVPVASQSLHLCVKDTGLGLTQPIRAISAVGAQTVSGIEWVKVK